MTIENITTHKIQLDPELLASFEPDVESEQLVVVHCKYKAQSFDNVRIWPSTFLFPHNSAHKSHLIHAENISYFPFWQVVPAGTTLHFTLIFTALPKDCQKFDLIEITTGLGSFRVENIERNDADIYSVDF